MSDFTKSGDYFMKDLLQQIWGEVNEKYGSKAKLPAGSFAPPE
jgi:hypothetical protein